MDCATSKILSPLAVPMCQILAQAVPSICPHTMHEVYIHNWSESILQCVATCIYKANVALSSCLRFSSYTTESCYLSLKNCRGLRTRIEGLWEYTYMYMYGGNSLEFCSSIFCHMIVPLLVAVCINLTALSVAQLLVSGMEHSDWRCSWSALAGC